MTETNVVEPTAPVSSESGLSFRGLVEVFYKPAEFFKKLILSPKVLVPYIVTGILMFLFLYAIRNLIWDMTVSSPKFQERMQSSPASLEQVRTITVYSTVIGGTVATLLAPLLAALLGLFWGNFVFAGKASFRQLLSVMLYGEVIYAVGAIVNLALMLPRGSLMANLSLGVLAAGQGPDSLLYVLLSKFSVFLIWEIAAIGIGLTALYNVKPSHGYRLSILSMGMLSILHVVITAIGKLF